MIECPYCGADAEDDARYCDRCGERLSFAESSRDGFLRRSSIQYLQGVRHGARPLDPEVTYHEELLTDVQAGLADFSHLTDVDELDLHEILDIDDDTLGDLTDAPSPDTDLDTDVRQALGVAALVALLENSYDGTTLDEIRAQAASMDE
ncbi:Zn-ribbon domain containing protein [Halorhabdus sp. SVX81]|uniref:zinc ribbon domain-containing protein n=1 Tax=Halorhabdus sp. SVX81 TaxID=2978283 RepID=UPI0023DC37A4|nr:zinc ribbon domain-containing protein [Halorhabdus sp. SVX81]WEL16992.1 Zn-ribbon domain containing protein [Halorhabdus sp. SVX81]